MPRRSRRVIVVAHCVLNANAKYVGGAAYPGANIAAIEPYLRDGVGIVQLPCPESSFLGMSRWAMTRNQYETVAYRRHCEQILRPTVDTLQEFVSAGYVIEGVMGIKGSPSCGVSETREGFTGGDVGGTQLSARVPGAGVMMSVLSRLLADQGLEVVLFDVGDPD